MRVVDVHPLHDDCLCRVVATILVNLVDGVAGTKEACCAGRECAEERAHPVARGIPAQSVHEDVGIGRSAGSDSLAGKWIMGRGGVDEAALCV